VRQAAAANLNTPPETLTDLAGDPEVSVRQAVATNPNTPPETLTILAANPDEGVQAAAAANPNCPKAGEAAKGLMADWGSEGALLATPVAAQPPERGHADDRTGHDRAPGDQPATARPGPHSAPVGAATGSCSDDRDDRIGLAPRLRP
jgi:hypothetical protein